VGDKKTEDGKSEEANDKKTEDKEDDVKVVNSGEELEEDEAKKIVESFTKDSGSCEYALHNVGVNTALRDSFISNMHSQQNTWLKTSCLEVLASSNCSFMQNMCFQDGFEWC